MYAKLKDNKLTYAPRNFNTDINLIINFNKNIDLMKQHGFKEVIDNKPSYDNTTQYLSVSGYTESEESITINYVINKIEESKEPTLEEKVESLESETLNLLSTDLDFDFRLMEIEITIGQPVNLNRSRGVRAMARTPYEMMKILILNGEYDKEDMTNKINVYYERGRITLQQKNELLGLIEANELMQ